MTIDCMTTSIKTLLTPFFQSKQHDWKIKLLTQWPTIMGPLAQHVCIVKIQDDLLLLGVYDSSWLQELYLLSSDLLNTINQNLDQPRIKQLRFKQVSRTTKKAPRQNVPIEQQDISISLTPREKMALHRIKNEMLRMALQSFLARCHRERMK